MKSDLRLTPVGPLLRFGIIFGLLIIPWPGWNTSYAEYFRGFAQWAFSSGDGARIVEFSANSDNYDALDTCMSLANREVLDKNGRGLFKRVAIDTRSIGWIPTALTMSLVAATPISWRRRSIALLIGLVLIHIFILFSLQAWIWDNSPDVSLVTLSGFWKRMTSELSYTLIDQLDASFTFPVLIWVLVTFTRHDKIA
jgi:hypothetical protein